MKIRILLAVGVVALGALLVAVPAFTEEEEPAAPGNPMEYYQKIATPGEHHRWLDFAVGKWTTETKWWMGPGEPQVSEGTAETAWVFDKHFLRTSYKGSMMGMPFHGELTMAYSVADKHYEQVWIDNGSTGLMVSSGKREGDVITMTGEAHTHFGIIPSRQVTTKKSDDEYVYESYWAIPNMGDFKVMEVRYLRAK